MSSEFGHLKVCTCAFVTIALLSCDILGEIFKMRVGLCFCLLGWLWCFCFTEVLQVFCFNYFLCLVT